VVGEAVSAVGPTEAIRLLWSDHFGDQRFLAGEIGVEVGEIESVRRRYPQAPRSGSAEEILRRMSRLGGQVISPEDPEWPVRVGDLGPFTPLVLYASGDIRLLNSESTLGVVGSRNPTPSGRHWCRIVVSRAHRVGYTLVSGGARGIDWNAHLEALALATPQVVVLATALDARASWQHDLLVRLAGAGVAITETPPGRSISRQSFLHRNRVIAALSDRVIVVEAANPSGSLNTASHAKKLGRDLSAVISRPLDCANAGCYRLVDEWGAEPYVAS
jgi:DNA processing protein